MTDPHETSYFAARAAQERRMAASSASDVARAAHRQLAEHYRWRVGQVAGAISPEAVD